MTVGERRSKAHDAERTKRSEGLWILWGDSIPCARHLQSSGGESLLKIRRCHGLLERRNLTQGDNWVETEYLLHEGLDIRQLFTILKSREPVAPNHSINFLLGPLLRFGVEGHSKEEGIYRRYGLCQNQCQFSTIHEEGSVSEREDLTVSAPPTR